MSEKKITADQLRSLQAMYVGYCKQQGQDAGDRHARLVWASVNVDRVLSSFNDLTAAEASKLIDLLKTSLGQEVIPPDRSKRRRSRESAHAAGTAGRRGSEEKTVQLATTEDLARIQAVLVDLGWDQARLEAFLRSGSSPLRGRGQVRTQADANKVYWALKRMRDRQQQERTSA